MSDAKLAVEPQLSARRCYVAHAWLMGQYYSLLLLEADRRGRHPDELVAEIVEVVLADNLVPALLDR